MSSILQTGSARTSRTKSGRSGLINTCTGSTGPNRSRWVKMDNEEEIRVTYHLATPVCRTMHGARVHLALISYDDLGLLCRSFGCSVEEIASLFWQQCRAVRGKA